ncbi:hypothetical protein K6Y31_20305 [Motilimonas cestriensis]|uniref:protein-secreting ATPase n=1 Tax=Motilimonas cestriensis TaxID=2742685 RepID=A0ABS8WFS6_9GAMM|nr:hypothetical protein [Motilimonas cestriensis]MCE2597120.1 hypothetical protein [Motilimonas cestriensis]
MKFDSVLKRLQLPISYNSSIRIVGCVTSVAGCFVTASGCQARVGDVARIISNGEVLECEVIGGGKEFILLPCNGILGIAVGDEVEFMGHEPMLNIYVDPYSKTLDGFGLIDNLRPSSIVTATHLYPRKVPVKERDIVSVKYETGCPILDSVLPIGSGQKVGVFAGSGIGKSTLINMLYKNIRVDIKIVVLVGERSREVVEFEKKHLNNNQFGETIIIASTSEDSPFLKRRSVYIGLAYAKYFSEKGKEVLLVIDSLTRLAHSMREIGISRGEAPVARGYPPSVFSELSLIVEQCGAFNSYGNITAVMSILVDGDDSNEPVSDYLRGILDAHLILDRNIANSGLYPPINILASRSRVVDYTLNENERRIEKNIRKVYSDYNKVRDVIDSGLYQKGTSEKIDALISIKKITEDSLHCWGEQFDDNVREEIDRYVENF